MTPLFFFYIYNSPYILTKTPHNQCKSLCTWPAADDTFNTSNQLGNLAGLGIYYIAKSEQWCQKKKKKKTRILQAENMILLFKSTATQKLQWRGKAAIKGSSKFSPACQCVYRFVSHMNWGTHTCRIGHGKSGPEPPDT